MNASNSIIQRRPEAMEKQDHSLVVHSSILTWNDPIGPRGGPWWHAMGVRADKLRK